MLWFGLPVFVSVFVGFILFYRGPLLDKKKRSPSFIPAMSIIIPARNEEYNLPNLLVSLKNQTLSPLETIVVDDNSTDGTAKIAKENGAQVVACGALPEGWLGKPWGCYQGASRAKGDLFVFLDADTFLEPDALEKIACNFNEAAGVISIFPYHRIKKPYEAFSAIFNLMQLAGMYQVSLKRNQEPAGMFGPCLIISRKDYFEVGGHKAVYGEILEHYVMASVLRKQNIPVHLFMGKGTVYVRMYSKGWKSLIKGWSKSFAGGAERTPRLNMSLSVLWISGLIVSFVLFLFSLFSGGPVAVYFWAGFYLLCVAQVLIFFRSVGNFPVWSAVFYPVNLLFFITVFAFSVYISSKKGKVEWKGRKI